MFLQFNIKLELSLRRVKKIINRQTMVENFIIHSIAAVRLKRIVNVTLYISVQEKELNLFYL